MLYTHVVFMCRVAQKVIWELAKKKKIEIQHVDKTVLERLSGNKPHQVGYRSGRIILQCLALRVL